MARLSGRLVLEDASGLGAAVLKGLADHLNQTISRSLPAIQVRAHDWVEKALTVSPEYASLLHGGDLRGQLGVVDPKHALDAVVSAIQRGVKVTHQQVRVVGNGLTGGFRVEILRDDMSEVLGLREGSFRSEHGHQIDWLNWMLTRGSALVITDYFFLPGPRSGSRTGLGIMVPSRRGWGLPEQFAGTVEDNWITRALHKEAETLARGIVEELERNS